MRSVLRQNAYPLGENENGPRRCVNTAEGLTHSSDVTREGLGMKPTRICFVADCDSPHVARGMCNAHYLRWRSGPDGIPAADCKVDGCPNRHASHGYCGTHARNYRENGDPLRSDGKGANHARWNADHTITYGGAHARVRRSCGPATAQTCVDCGGAAQEWAYDHLDATDHVFDSPKGPLRYSANPAHYMPMCKPCHTRFDRRAHQLLAVA